MLYSNLEQMIGNTPLFLPKNWLALRGISTEILCKLEKCNPAGSAKDRVALAMLRDAEERGVIREGATVIEPTSGNTGIGLASLAAARGYRMILTMPDTLSAERISLLKAFGAEVVLTPGAEGMRGAIAKAEEFAQTIPNSFIPSQFDNPSNPHAHYLTTGPEIWRDSDGRVDALVAGVGTGGTLCGAGRYLKEQNPACLLVAVEPERSPLLSKGISGPHGLQGIGANFVPKNFDLSLCDEILPVTEEEAYRAAREFAKTEGILVGISSGAALHAAALLTASPIYKDCRIAVILPDTGDRYLSTALFSEEN